VGAVTAAQRVLRVRIDQTLLDLPAASVVRIGRLARAGWSGLDAQGGALQLVATDHGPMIALSAPLLLQTDAVSPQPSWGVVLTDGAEPLLAVAVCEVLGLMSADAASSSGISLPVDRRSPGVAH